MLKKMMRTVIKIAKDSKKAGDYPIGAAVFTLKGKLVAKGVNEVIRHNDPSGHAEVVAIREAAKVLGTRHLYDCILVSTLEPCNMCQGCVIWSRIPSVAYGGTLEDLKNFGSKKDKNKGSKYNWAYAHLSCSEGLSYSNWPIIVYGGIEREKCKELMEW